MSPKPDLKALWYRLIYSQCYYRNYKRLYLKFTGNVSISKVGKLLHCVSVIHYIFFYLDFLNTLSTRAIVLMKPFLCGNVGNVQLLSDRVLFYPIELMFKCRRRRKLQDGRNTDRTPNTKQKPNTEEGLTSNIHI